MAQYLSYRNGGMKLSDRIPDALAHFSLRVGKPPVALVVNPRDLEAATEHIKMMGITLPVIGNGGVALSEIWLQERV